MKKEFNWTTVLHWSAITVGIITLALNGFSIIMGNWVNVIWLVLGLSWFYLAKKLKDQ